MKEINLVSIIVPIYNAEKKLEKCVESIINQTYKNIEILLINDGSTDNSSKIIEKYEKIDTRIKAYTKNNSGVSSTRNYGIERAKGKYVFFIDADDSLDKEVISNLVERAELNENYLEGALFKSVRNGKKEICRYKEKRYNKDEFIKLILNGEVLGVVWNYLFELEKIGELRFDENTSFLEDSLFLIEYLEKIEYIEISNANNNYYNYYYYSDSISHNSEILKKINDLLYSLNFIDKITDEKYKKEIYTKKIKLIKCECKKMHEIKEIEDLLENREIKKLLKNNISLFSLMYKMNNPYIIKFYYTLRNKIKGVYYKLINVRNIGKKEK